MSVAIAQAPEQRFVWYQLSWDQYEALLRALGDRGLRRLPLRIPPKTWRRQHGS